MQHILCLKVRNIKKYEKKIAYTILIQLLLIIYASEYSIYQDRTLQYLYGTYCNRLEKRSSTKDSRKTPKATMQNKVGMATNLLFLLLLLVIWKLWGPYAGGGEHNSSELE
jgi:hypothetical protein